MVKIIDRLKKQEEKQLKSIELINYINVKDMKIIRSNYKLSDFNKIERIGTYDGYDVIKCYHWETEFLYLGHWNDGVIE